MLGERVRVAPCLGVVVFLLSAAVAVRMRTPRKELLSLTTVVEKVPSSLGRISWPGLSVRTCWNCALAFLPACLLNLF